MKHICIALTLLLSMSVVDATAQSLLNRLGKAVEKGVQNQINKSRDKIVDNVTKQNEESKASSQPATQTPQGPSQSKSNQAHKIQTIDVVIPYGPTSGEIGGHKWVDMGLPSGTRWATCNVDAISPEQPGKHYSWGEITTKTSYTEANTKYYKKDIEDFSGDKASDVAAAKWGAGWRMPTIEEFKELDHYCSWDYVQKNGRWGVEFTSHKTNNTIFLPATGAKDGTSINEPNGCGMYWTSTPHKDNWNNGAHEYHFGAALGEMGIAERYYGYAVRPVVDYDVKIEVPSSGEIEGHKWVDLGLPSGLKWATCNLGADAVDQDGEYFVWGEITPYSEGAKNKLYGESCSDIAGSAQYDAARALWGGTWRMPMLSDFEELIENCTFEWTSIGRRSGLKVTSKTNGNYIFLPASGGFESSKDSYGFAYDINSKGAYWSSTPSRNNNTNTYAFNLIQSQFIVQPTIRFYGFTIRPVSE